MNSLSTIILLIDLIRIPYGLFILIHNKINGMVWLLIATLEMACISVYIGNDASIYIAILMAINAILDIIILLYPLKHKPVNPDFMLVLGNSLKKNKMSKTLTNRLDTAYLYYQNHQNIRIIVSGGITGKNTTSEARAMNEYLKKKGVNPSNILLEDTSSTTVLNIENSIKKYPLIKDSNILVVSSSYHLLRASLILNKKGIKEHALLKARTPFLLLFDHLLFEKIYIFLLLINKLK